MTGNTSRALHDVSHVPSAAFGPKTTLWWGNLAFMVIEGLGFVFAVATYLYFYTHNESWPIGPQLPLFWSTIIMAVMLLSEIPNVWLKRVGQEYDLKKTRIGLVIMSVLGVLLLGLRYFEFKAMNVSWDSNVYGSISWFLLGLHTTHLITDVGETLVMTTCIFIGPVDAQRFPEVEDNQDYWHFVVFFWGVVYVTLYWIPRWFEVLP